MLDAVVRIISVVPPADLIDFLANRYGVSPFEVQDWPLFPSVIYYYAGVRNTVRDRINNIQDDMAVGDLSLEVKSYDKKGKLIKGEGRTDPIGFRNHLQALLSILGIDEKGKTLEEIPPAEKPHIADKLLDFLMQGGS